ncbi:MAG TPA: peptide deformylase, partial [Campylobacterales bacterium]|nr:peptide deformylase [Campylobacterales bacterium]
MVRDILTYPDDRINIISPDLRVFDAKLLSVIEDLKDTINHHNASAMSAIQIGVAMSVVVVKEADGSFLEIINPRIIRKSGLVDSTESTLYFPNVTLNIKRFEKIKLIYQDRDA